MKKYIALLAVLFGVIGLAVFGNNEETNASIEKKNLSLSTSPQSNLKQE